MIMAASASVFSFFNSRSLFVCSFAWSTFVVESSCIACSLFFYLFIVCAMVRALFDFQENVILSKRKSKYFLCASSSSLLLELLLFFSRMLLNAPASSFHPATPINSGIYERKMKPHRDHCNYLLQLATTMDRCFVFALALSLSRAKRQRPSTNEMR